MTYTAPTFVDVPQAQWGSPPGNAVALDAAHLNGLAQAVQSASAASLPGGYVISKVTPGTTADQASILNAEISALATAGGGTLVLPRGTISVSSVVVGHLVTLQGAGAQVTVLKDISSSGGTGLVTMPVGPVFHWIKDLQVQGVGNAGKRGIYMRAVGTGGTPNQGGWWYGGMKNVLVQGFASDQIWLRGGGADALKPHQFLVLENVQAFTTGTSCALRVTGQVGQVDMVQCQFDGPGQSNNGTNVFIGREVDDSLTVISDSAPYFIKALGVTCQSNRRGVVMERCAAVTWIGYFEAVSEGLSAAATAEGIVVEGCTFQNTGANAGSGFCIQVGAGSEIIARDNLFPSPADMHLKVSGGALTQSLNYVSGGAPLKTSGMTSQFAVGADGSLLVYGARTCLVNSSATAITTVTSYAVGTGETLSLKAWGGTIVLGSGGNVDPSGLTFPYTVPAGAIVTLIRYDLGGTWQIQSITP